MLAIAQQINPDVQRAVHFATEVLGATNVAFYRTAENVLPYDFVLHNVRPEFHVGYMSGMIKNDPLNVPRLAAQSKSVFCLDEEAQKLDPATVHVYRDFLASFGLAESIEFVFRREGMLFGGMGVIWADRRARAQRLASSFEAIHSYLEFNLSRSLDVQPPAVELTPKRFAFTSREREVADLLCCGRTNHEIARSLQISCATVKTHLIHIFDKMGADNRTCAAAMLARVH